MGIMTKKLYFDLLENKERVKKELQYEIHDDSLDLEKSEDKQEDDVLSDPVGNHVQLEESLLNDLLQSENEPILENNQPVPLLEKPIEKKSMEKEKPVVKPVKSAADITNTTNTKNTTNTTKIPPVNKPPVKIEKHVESVEHLEILAKKQELLIKFDILRKNTERYIPQYTMNHNYSIMKNHYKLLVKQLHLDGKVTTYKQMLLGASGYLEIFLGNFVGLDMEGFTKHQADNIHVYDKILTKLSEKSFTPTKFIESFPLEFQLLLTVGFQTLLFILTKTLPIAQIFQSNPV